MISYGFFNSVNGDRTYDADDISNYFLKLISNGVFATPSSAMQVTVSSGMMVQVSAGWGFINCKWIENDAAYLLTLDSADVVLNRIDRIVLRLDYTNRQMGIYISKGIPASAPVAPTLQRVDGEIWELSLAQIAVNAGATEITQANITDERANASLCGYVTGLIDQIDTTNLFAQFTDSFNSWFTTVKETLATTTLVRQYSSVYITSTTSETIIPINISEYNYTLDVLNVYINGLRLIPGVDYTENGSANTITLANTLDVVGTPVSFEVLKSIDGSEAESVVDMVYQLQTEIGKIDANNYYCNGVNDNTTLQNWLAELDSVRQSSVINIIGSFGVDGTQYTASDGNTYSFIYEGESLPHGITLDFSHCYPIHARGNSFAYFNGCKVEGLTVIFDEVTNANPMFAICAENCTLENCDVYGSLSGTPNVVAYNISNCRMIECDSDLTGVGNVTGILAVKSIITCCNIKVHSEGASNSCYGIDMGDASRCDNSTFSATADSTSTSHSGCGGIGGGYYSNCSFEGSGGMQGFGFYVRANALLNANNCIFRGYTESSAFTAKGNGIFGPSSSGTTLFLTGINCNQITKSGYSQTGSMVFADGYGSYMGVFFTAPNVPSTIVSFGSFNRNRV